LTDLSRPDGPAEPDDTDDAPAGPADAVDSAGAGAPEAPTRALGLTAFRLDGRRAPALFVVGWLATLLGIGFVAIRMLGVVGGAGLVFWYGGLALATVGLVLLGGSQAVERPRPRCCWLGSRRRGWEGPPAGGRGRCSARRSRGPSVTSSRSPCRRSSSSGLSV